jgi:predicted acetyltransferase
VKVDGVVGGFALVRRTAEGAMEMAEFYILPGHRRGGIGLQFARALIARFAGRWNISQYKANAGAVNFWRRVVEGRTFTEHDYVSDNGNARIAQSFTV